ncbi:MAG: Na(+)-translocating NADH-quinone reductase subunit C [Pseudomonadales bacterium]|jgi:Na+-transporting NADH:ubiquinone oxidoreductase subunit C|nr:Na(+)-translocating NADH-quinone reductase subunit C [Pseudomonadales bacterium]
MAKKETVSQTLIVAFVLCIVCAVIVSSAAVILKPKQEANKELERKINVLAAAGMMEKGADVDQLFSRFTAKVVDLDSGAYLDVDPSTIDSRKEAKNPALSTALSKKDDLAKINRRANRAIVYILEKDQEIDTIVLPIHGYGLWSTLYGFLALEGDLNTVAGLGFYSHTETPGLGGEIDNPRWKAQWPGKKLYNQSGDLAIQVTKGKNNPELADSIHKIDGLSGATLTTRGVDNLVHYWLSEGGYGPFLAQLNKGG